MVFPIFIQVLWGFIQDGIELVKHTAGGIIKCVLALIDILALVIAMRIEKAGRSQVVCLMPLNKISFEDELFSAFIIAFYFCCLASGNGD
ncbi:hypothetical protein J1N35_013353 [Gossypium stocksii]|uniref:Uncharacterized protein n=1 Tax=Gossypium stocksii TaxID=47602 RepID=A0A9D3VSJ7_9ROSI|nr:hypothetical protein J1N35_013353 [Gossypium stocksii]